MKRPKELLAALVLGSLVLTGGPALASRCSDSHRDGMGAFQAAATVQTEMRRTIRARAAAADRLEIIDREIERREAARDSLEAAEKYCDGTPGAQGPRPADLQSLIHKNDRRLREARCQRLGFRARALMDDAAAFGNAAEKQRADIRDRFQSGYEALKRELHGACPKERERLGIQLAKIEHHALTLLAPSAGAGVLDRSRDDHYRTALRHYKTRDFRAAARQFRAAAEAGHARAQYYLGRLHMEGWGVEKSDDMALFWFKESAERGDPAGQNSLGLMYDLGRGVPEDDATAVMWYARAADQGLPFAQTNLGQMYEQGEGVRRDPEVAVKLYRAAADHGHIRAHYRLGRVYERGLGVKKDLTTAITFYQRAADRGFKPAQQALAALGG